MVDRGSARLRVASPYLGLIWPFIVLGLAAYIATKIGRHLAERRDQALAARRAACDAIRARAGAQHAQVLRGGPAGAYGDYPVPILVGTTRRCGFAIGR
jgi:hypothetical protein